ncbi:MAG: UvrD-helicase domain-containing protein [Erysipelotrichales bacterium]|nr:UvrD-helicase domain-containing protein [Erysipelotrichales bacterium]
MAWTSEQLRAINIRNVNAIVSAGAGSGKTAVLTERAFNIIKNKEANVDELLILTFTNAAAHEMKERIIALLRNEKYFEQADQVEGSNVTTFDAYALYLVKKYNYYFDIPKNVSILDENIVKIKEYEILDKIFDNLYQANDRGFIDLISTFVVKDDRVIKDYIIKILHLADLKINKMEYLLNHNAEIFDIEYIENLLNEVITISKDYIKDYINMCDYFENSDVSYDIIEALSKLINTNSYDEFYEACSLFKLKVFRNLSEEDKALKGAIVGGFKPLRERILKMGSKETVINFLTKEQYKNAYKYLFNIAIQLDEELRNFKISKNSFTFSDIAKMALELVNDQNINKELKESIKFIMVDEYQDTSDIQEAFISKLANNNLFMVGDTKQSIYSFRNANCNIFQNKYEEYKSGVNGEKIDLNFNFRSRQEVVEDLNIMFSDLMSKKIGSVDYKIDHISKAGNNDYLILGDNHENNHFEVLCFDSSETSLKKAEYEAHLLAQDIINKLNGNYKVYDKKSKSLRSCKYSDFAILIDKKKQFELYKKVFDKYQIPLKSYQDDKLISSLVGNLFYDALMVIHKIGNEQFDVEFKHTLIGLMRSFAYQMSDSEIYDYVQSDSLLLTKAYKDMESIAKLVFDLPLGEIVLKLYEVLDIYNKLVLIGDIEENEIIVDHLYNVAKTMQDLDYSLDDFIKYINDLKELGIDIDSSIDDSVDDVVKLMTIHKSKGLEFAIVYMPQLESNFFLSGGDRSSFKTSLEYGLILPIIGESDDKYLNILSFLNSEITKSKTLSERIRLFYVALTRAKEKAILFMEKNDKDEMFNLRNSRSFYDFLAYYQNTSKNKLLEKEVKFVEVNLQNEMPKQYDDCNLSYLERPVIELPTAKDKVRASKIVDENSNVSALGFGSELHYLLELIDFKTKDISFIKDEKKKKYLRSVLELDLFKDIDQFKVFKEYAFSDEENEMIGIIDLLLIGESEIKIIDYKTKNIDDESYERQLKIYQNFISKKFNMPVHTYLLSIIDAQLKEVK